MKRLFLSLLLLAGTAHAQGPYQPRPVTPATITGLRYGNGDNGQGDSTATQAQVSALLSGGTGTLNLSGYTLTLPGGAVAAALNGQNITPTYGTFNGYLQTYNSFMVMSSYGHGVQLLPVTPDAGAKLVDIASGALAPLQVGTLTAGWAVTPLTSAANLSAAGGIFLCNTSGGTFTVTLPDATTCKGREFYIKKVDTVATTSVVIATTNSQTIDGAGNNNINIPNASILYVSDGANWTRPNYFPGLALKFFSSTATKTVSNTAAATSIVPTGTATSSMTRGAGYLAVGRSIYITTGGVFSVPANSSLTFQLTINGTVLASTSATTGMLATAVTNAGWDAPKVQIETLTTGTSGTVIATGTVTINGTAYQLSTATPVTVDTTVAPVFDFRAQFDAASTTRSITTNAFVASGAL